MWKTLPETTLFVCAAWPAYGVGGVMNTSLCTKGEITTFRSLRDRGRKGGGRGSGKCPPSMIEGEVVGKMRRPSLAVRRRRIMDTYAHQMQSAMDLLGDIDPETVERL